MNPRFSDINDLEGIFELGRKVFSEHAYSQATIRQLFDLFPSLTIVQSDASGTVIGFVLAAYGEDGVCWTLLGAVEDRFRRKGIGNSLMRTMLEKSNASEFRLTVDPDNVAAQALYRKLGFEKVAQSENYFGDGRPRDLFKLNAV